MDIVLHLLVSPVRLAGYSIHSTFCHVSDLIINHVKLLPLSLRLLHQLFHLRHILIVQSSFALIYFCILIIDFLTLGDSLSKGVT